MQGFRGQPPYCKPECVSNSECAAHLACVNQKCKDPCVHACGVNAECRVVSHSAMCVCPDGYRGDPFSQCELQPSIEVLTPCSPSPCGSNAVCREQNKIGSCVCNEGYFGNPHEGCRPECVADSDCPGNRGCISNKCQDPCPGTCGVNAECITINHAPKCSCLIGFTGDPFRRCNMLPRKYKTICSDYTRISTSSFFNFMFLSAENIPINVCSPSPCGPNSQCRVTNGQAVCSCLPNYNGNPPLCKPECTINSDCAPDRACINQKCFKPCPGPCGQNTECRVFNHNPICSCKSGFTGDPFSRCYAKPGKIFFINLILTIRSTICYSTYTK